MLASATDGDTDTIPPITTSGRGTTRRYTLAIAAGSTGMPGVSADLTAGLRAPVLAGLEVLPVAAVSAFLRDQASTAAVVSMAAGLAVAAANRSHLHFDGSEGADQVSAAVELNWQTIFDGQ